MPHLQHARRRACRARAPCGPPVRECAGAASRIFVRAARRPSMWAACPSRRPAPSRREHHGPAAARGPWEPVTAARRNAAAARTASARSPMGASNGGGRSDPRASPAAGSAAAAAATGIVMGGGVAERGRRPGGAAASAATGRRPSVRLDAPRPRIFRRAPTTRRSASPPRPRIAARLCGPRRRAAAPPPGTP